MTDIPDEVDLYRRIHPTHVKPDGAISSAAFKDPDLSCDDSRQCGPEITGGRGCCTGVAKFHAGFARERGQSVEADPELDNPAHCLVRGNKKRECKAFAIEANRRGWAWQAAG